MGDCQQGLSINNVEKIALWHRVVAKMLSYHISQNINLEYQVKVYRPSKEQ